MLYIYLMSSVNQYIYIYKKSLIIAITKTENKMIPIVWLLFSLTALNSAENQFSKDGFDERFPEENPGLFEGDIELDGVNPFSRNAIGNKHHLWPKGRIPYYIPRYFSGHTRHTIHSAMTEIQEKTGNCIQFIPRHRHHRYSMSFAGGKGCHSPIGFKGTHQIVTLGNGCLIKGVVIHEILHSIGFFHEQSRPDRDDYIQVIRSNIIKGKEGNFRKFFPPTIDTQHFPYDYNSIMHYGKYSFAKDRHQPTIVPRQTDARIGQRYGLSPIDIQEIRKLYGCS